MAASLPPEIQLAQALAEADEQLGADLAEHRADFGDILASVFLAIAARRMIELAQSGEHRKLQQMCDIIETALVGDQVATDMIRFGLADTFNIDGKADLLAPFLGPKLRFWTAIAP